MTERAVAQPLVVLVEDDPEVLAVLSRQMQRLLPHATIIAQAQGALALAQLTEQPVMLAVVDYYLPGQAGLAIVAALRAHSPQVRTIVMTASPTEEIERSVQQAGVDVLLSKPFLLQELARAVHQLLPDEQATSTA
jgi:two-component system capsular synthesis response regulator RcsB